MHEGDPARECYLCLPIFGSPKSATCCERCGVLWGVVREGGVWCRVQFESVTSKGDPLRPPYIQRHPNIPYIPR